MCVQTFEKPPLMSVEVLLKIFHLANVFGPQFYFAKFYLTKLFHFLDFSQL